MRRKRRETVAVLEAEWVSSVCMVYYIYEAIVEKPKNAVVTCQMTGFYEVRKVFVQGEIDIGWKYSYRSNKFNISRSRQ